MQTGFFNVLSVVEFVSRLKDFSHLSIETLPLGKADGRVLATDVISPENLPLAARSCMDGYALSAQDVFGASETAPAYIEHVGNIDIEHPADFSLNPGECASIVTGGILPAGADAVVMVEHTEVLGAGTIEIRKSLAPTENVMLKGEDTEQGAIALANGTFLRPQEIGLLAALGITEVPVIRMPRVGILSTGDELIPVTQRPRAGQVRDVNSYTLACLVERMGGTPKCYGIIKDDLESLTKGLQQAVEENDVVFLSGGSSVGTRDLTVSAIDLLTVSPCTKASAKQHISCAELINHGVAISPGKPLILAKAETVEGTKAIWGLPGQIASAQVVMFILGVPFLQHLAGATNAFDQSLWPSRRARLARNIASRQGREDYVRVKVTHGTEGAIATPVTGKSGLLRTMLQSDGVVRIPAESEGMYENAELDVLLFQR